MIEIRNLTRRYPGQINLLENLSLSLEPGSWLMLKGSRNAGKTTLLRLLAGLDQPTSGTLTWYGEALQRRAVPTRLRQRTGLLFDPPMFLEPRSLHDNLSLPLEIQGMAQKDIDSRVSNALQRVGLAGQERQSAISLGCEDRQRLNLARAIVGRPTLLLVDEVWRNGCNALIPLLQNILETFHASGVTVVVAHTPGQPGLIPRGREFLLPEPLRERTP